MGLEFLWTQMEIGSDKMTKQEKDLLQRACSAVLHGVYWDGFNGPNEVNKDEALNFACELAQWVQSYLETNNKEYCVMYDLNKMSKPDRGPWSFEECLEWVKEWEDDGGRPGAFYIAIRDVGPWKKIGD